MISGVGQYNSYLNYPPMSGNRRDPSELFNKVDSDGSKGISQSELDAFTQSISSKTGQSIDTSDFSQYDTNGDGELSSDEFQSFMAANLPPPGGMTGMTGSSAGDTAAMAGPPPAGMTGMGGMGQGHHHGHGDLFKAVDTDSSGGISESELDAFAQNLSNTSGQSIDTSDFSQYDTNQDGVLSKAEFKSFMEASGITPPGPPPDSSGAGTTASADATTTGASSAQSAEDIISEYDTNGDGELSSDELQAYMDDNSNTASLQALFQQAMSAYSTDSGGGQPAAQENALMDFGGLNAYNPIDLSA